MITKNSGLKTAPRKWPDVIGMTGRMLRNVHIYAPPTLEFSNYPSIRISDSTIDCAYTKLTKIYKNETIFFGQGSNMKTLVGNAQDVPAELLSAMFRDRAVQFHNRLNWDVEVNSSGEEIDQYDCGHCKYVIITGENKEHLGSMRLLPITTKNMLFDSFLELVPEGFVKNDQIWECTRFCVAPKLNRTTAKQVVFSLMLGSLRFGIKSSIKTAVGVFDERMLKIYKQVGWEPTIIGTSLSPHGTIRLGVWSVNSQELTQIERKYDALMVEKNFKSAEFSDPVSYQKFQAERPLQARVFARRPGAG